MKKIIAIDLDGTTLNARSLISPKTQLTLLAAKKAGHEVIIATGRPYRMSHQFYQQLQLNNPMVNLNGAIIHIPEQRWQLEKQSLVARDLVFDLIEQRQNLGINFVAAENKETYFIDALDHFDEAFFAGPATVENLLTPKNLTTDPASIMLGTTMDNAVQLATSLQERYGNFVDVRTWGGPNAILEMTQKGVQKASGLAYLAKSLGFKQSDVIAFGDEHNDVEMLAWAGWGVAMKNGTKEALSAANDATRFTNDEDGLADYLTEYLGLEIGFSENFQAV
ncbi:Cof-type HAD-IIB family hydrolase [Enterococcus timonensis]|uniref:Cof-type HAD-IIB family hydrolase n=1 Tax=Enterococcus timonensis TaxID=1852364 RepID=UPI0008DA75E6|nr:Cof-type HAD-IIB family hydrolase [Enterococcus timonensis]